MTPPDKFPPIPPELNAWRILSSLGDSVAVVDRDFRIIYVREPLLDPDVPSAKLVGRRCYAALAGRRTPCDLNCPVTPVFQSGRPASAERHFVDPDGIQRWREARAFPVVDGAGRVAFVARISFDITERKRRRDSRRRRRETLEQALYDLSRLRLQELPFQPEGGPGLTGRELEVLRLMAQGLTKPQIGDVLGISLNTVKRHASNLFDKIGVNDRAQAAVWAVRQGLV